MPMNIKTKSIISIIFALALFRLMQLVPNLSPVAAMALFAGAKFNDKKLAFIVPFAALLLSDLVLGLHSTMIFVYSAFALTVLAGISLRKHQNIISITLMAIGSSLMFYLVTNAGVWLMYDTYAPGFAGLMEAYIAGIPFYQNTLLGDLAFTAVLFGGYALIQQSFKPKAIV